MNKEELERKLKRERVEACLNCKKLVKCDDVGKFEECGEFKEVEGEGWVIRKNTQHVQSTEDSCS